MSDQTLTFADICTAIADGSIVATFDGSTYSVSPFELRRYLKKSRSQPTISSTDIPTSSLLNEASNWSANGQTSVA